MDTKNLFLKKIAKYPDLLIYKDCYFKDFNTFHVNNLIEIMLIPKSIHIIRQLILDLKTFELAFVIIGNGSKILFKDFYVHKIVILLNYNFSNILLEENEIYAYSGAKLAQIIHYGLKHQFGLMEELIGIPACLGGAIYKNAGAHNKAISEWIISVDYIDEFGNFKTLTKEECQFSYRNSIFQKKKKWVILGAKLQIQKTDLKQAKEKIQKILLYRMHHQPRNHHNCGSVFKNPPTIKAYQLIEQCQFKGYRIGDAMISEQHANFILNLNQAKSSDICHLIQKIQQKVYEKFQIHLELELEII